MLINKRRQSRQNVSSHLSPSPLPQNYSSLSIIIATHGQRVFTETCLRSLLADVPDAEIILVDNGSPDDTVRWARSQPVRLIPLGCNRGVGAAWNIGLRAARGDVLCVLNNDTEILPGGMRDLAASAWRTGISAFHGGMMDREFNFLDFTRDPALADYADGCALLFRRDVWERVGEFDEGFEGAYCEDTDWSFRARELGYGFAICPESLIHYGGTTSRELPQMGTWQRRNLERLKLKWRGKGVGERILVRRWAALGDVLMATPVLAALRREKPLARLHLQCAPPIAEALQGLPGVDAVSSTRSGSYTSEYMLDGVYETREESNDWQHPALAFAQSTGLPINPAAYLVPATPELEEWAMQQLPDSGSTAKGYVACGIRSAFRSKVNWNERSWIELVRSMPDTTFVLLDPEPRPAINALGIHRDRRLFDEPNVLDCSGQTPSIRHVLALLRRCSAAVTVDTGLLHLAGGVGLPTVALIGAGAGWARLPLAGKAWAFQGQAPCYPCRNVSQCSRTDGMHCLNHVKGVDVANALQRVMPLKAGDAGWMKD